MKDCTYYDLLGVSSSATDEEINAAKNFLVKKFHPDSNMDTKFDTTAYIQNILFAYKVLSDPKKRRAYDRHIEMLSINSRNGKAARPKRNAPLSPDFTPYWEAANKLNDLVKKSASIIAEENAEKKRGFKLPIRKEKEQTPEHDGRLAKLSREASKHISTLESADIPREYWCPHAMNWVLFQWTQNRDYSYDMLFAMYDGYMAQKKNGTEKRSIQSASTQFQKDLDTLLSFSVVV